MYRRGYSEDEIAAMLMLSLIDKKALVKAMAKLDDPRHHAIAGSHAKAAPQRLCWRGVKSAEAGERRGQEIDG